MAEVTIPCPVCKSDIVVEVTEDLQGDGAWAMLMTFADIIEKPCYCMLSRTQEESVINDAAWDALETDSD